MIKHTYTELSYCDFNYNWKCSIFSCRTFNLVILYNMEWPYRDWRTRDIHHLIKIVRIRLVYKWSIQEFHDEEGLLEVWPHGDLMWCEDNCWSPTPGPSSQQLPPLLRLGGCPSTESPWFWEETFKSGAQGQRAMTWKRSLAEQRADVLLFHRASSTGTVSCLYPLYLPCCPQQT